MIEELKCKDCGKVIGHINSISHRIIDTSKDFNSCDICGEEICFGCSVTDEALEFNGCKKCHEKLTKIYGGGR